MDQGKGGARASLDCCVIYLDPEDPFRFCVKKGKQTTP